MKTSFGLVLALAAALAACSPKPPAAAADGKPAAEATKAGDNDAVFARLSPWKSSNPEVRKTANGVEYVILKHGDPKGAHPKPSDIVEVTYDGRLAADGKKFDATEPGDTATFGLSQVIPGWTEGMQELVPGDEAMFFIPSKMGYAERGAGDRIPPNSDLMFLITLKDIVQPKLSDEAAWKKALPWPKTGAVKTASGLEYIVVASGPKTEEPPADKDGVLLYYSGRLGDGKEFDSTYGAPQPTPMGVGDLIPGWREALKLMRPGDHWILKLPPDLAFGDEGRGPIPPKSPIYIECDLVKVLRIPDAPAAATPPAPPQPPK
jgi:FKBP-type peptidyl-prolyl cis-trans isomerase